jgi:hypothetical protein
MSPRACLAVLGISLLLWAMILGAAYLVARLITHLLA